MAPAPAARADGEVMLFEVFDESLTVRSLPIVVFSDEVDEQRVWKRGGSIAGGHVVLPEGPPSVRAKDPVVMSPAYLGFAIEPYEARYLHYMGVGIVFSRPHRGQFMQPSIDTLLVCRALHILFQSCSGARFPRAIDVGAGSGFIGKFAAVHAPGVMEVCLVDTDPAAKEYWASKGFEGEAGRRVKWNFQASDAIPLLEGDASWDLIVSNPPYIPTLEEVRDADRVSCVSSFWEGCGLLVFLIELMLDGKCAAGSHLVLALTSLTLKARRVCTLLAAASLRGVRVRILLEREVAWKAWYAGTGSAPTALLASDAEFGARQQLGDNSFFLGATRPGASRGGGSRDVLWGYHWHVAYVLDLSRKEADA